jgi:hypothetical protein
VNFYHLLLVVASLTLTHCNVRPQSNLNEQVTGKDVLRFYTKNSGTIRLNSRVQFKLPEGMSVLRYATTGLNTNIDFFEIMPREDERRPVDVNVPKPLCAIINAPFNPRLVVAQGSIEGPQLNYCQVSVAPSAFLNISANQLNEDHLVFSTRDERYLDIYELFVKYPTYIGSATDSMLRHACGEKKDFINKKLADFGRKPTEQEKARTNGGPSSALFRSYDKVLPQILNNSESITPIEVYTCLTDRIHGTSNGDKVTKRMLVGTMQLRWSGDAKSEPVHLHFATEYSAKLPTEEIVRITKMVATNLTFQKPF